MGNGLTRTRPRVAYSQPNPWFLTLNPHNTNTQHTNMAPSYTNVCTSNADTSIQPTNTSKKQGTMNKLEEQLKPGTSLCITFYPFQFTSASAKIYLASDALGSENLQYQPFFDVRLGRETEVRIRCSKDGSLFFTQNGPEQKIKEQGINFQRPVNVMLELENAVHQVRQTNDVELLYLQNVEKFEGAPEPAGIYPGYTENRETFEIMELLRNQDTVKAFLGEPLTKGNKFYLHASRINPAEPFFIQVYATNTALQNVATGEVTLFPFDVITCADKCITETVIKLRCTRKGEVVSSRDLEGTKNDIVMDYNHTGLKKLIDLKKPLYIFVELLNMTLNVIRAEDGDMRDRSQYILHGHLGGELSRPPHLRTASAAPPPIERQVGRPRLHFLQYAGSSRPIQGVVNNQRH